VRGTFALRHQGGVEAPRGAEAQAGVVALDRGGRNARVPTAGELRFEVPPTSKRMFRPVKIWPGCAALAGRGRVAAWARWHCPSFRSVSTAALPSGQTARRGRVSLRQVGPRPRASSGAQEKLPVRGGSSGRLAERPANRSRPAGAPDGFHALDVSARHPAGQGIRPRQAAGFAPAAPRSVEAPRGSPLPRQRLRRSRYPWSRAK
jgi:hypothetical protein